MSDITVDTTYATAGNANVGLTEESFGSVADELLSEIRLLQGKMQRDRTEIERLQIETKLLRAEFLRQTMENQATLNRLKVNW